MVNKITLNSISDNVFRVNSGDATRDDIVAAGIALTYEYARNGQQAVLTAMNSREPVAPQRLNADEYKALNERFRNDMLVFAANQACAQVGRKAPANFEEFKKVAPGFRKNSTFIAVLQDIWQEILYPIIPAVYSTAVSIFADTYEVGFSETVDITIESGDIPIFQDSAWGASRSVPANRFYAKTYTMNPQPKTCEIRAKWHQIIGNNTDWGQFFANVTAGLYAKTMGMWSAAMLAASADTTKIPTGLTYAFSDINWITLANKLGAVNNVGIRNLIAYGNAVALAKVLPTQATGSSNTAMDAALATLLGADYIRSGYLGEFLGVRLMPLVDSTVPNTQFGNVTTILPSDKIWMMSASGRKPMAIAYNRDVPITIEIEPEETTSFEYVMNLTTALDMIAVFAARVGLVTI